MSLFFASDMIPDDANIFSVVKNYYNRKSCFRASSDAKNVSHGAFCSFIHCKKMYIQQELQSYLTRFGWQDNNNRKTIQQESVSNPYCFASRRLWHIVGHDIEKQCNSLTINTLNYSVAKCSKLSKEWAREKTARSFDSFGQLKTQISYTF